MERIDLHVHSNASDGSLTPTEVADEAMRSRTVRDCPDRSRHGRWRGRNLRLYKGQAFGGSAGHRTVLLL